jgi:hypothetical protein
MPRLNADEWSDNAVRTPEARPAEVREHLRIGSSSGGLSEAMICWATWSPRPGRELEAKPALRNS